MSLLEITGLTHTFGDVRLYKDAEFTLNKGEHIGIVGKNGAGKSTLIKICTQEVIPDEGRVVWQPGITVGHLDQYAEIDGRITMENFLKTAFASQYEMERKMNDLYQHLTGDDTEKLYQAARYQEQLEQLDFYSIDTRIRQVAEGLGLCAVGLEKPVSEMSGGQRAKVILAKLLLEKPDVLLLDEPTNFLDQKHVEWLAEYLSGLDNAYMTVSHDFRFLEKIANRICDIDNGRFAKYTGKYSEYLKKKTLLREDYIRQYVAQQKEIKKTEEFIRKNIAGRKSKMARGRQKQLDRMEKMESIAVTDIKPYFQLKELPLTATEHLAVKQLAVGYHYPVLPDVSFAVNGGQKVVITGFNGIGKSTLFRTLMGQIPALSGRFTFSEQVKTGYFQQDLVWEKDSLTPVQIVNQTFPELGNKEVRKQLARCGISGRLAVQSVATLSGGEQAKVKMCLLTLTPCNFLIMDEPTNHLDANSKEALKAALCEFSGTVLLVSHEESFYRDWADKVIRLEYTV